MKEFVLSIITVLMLCSCGTSETTISTGVNLREYKHCVLGTENINGDADVTDIVLKVENILPEVFTIVSRNEAESLILDGKKVLTPSTNVKSEKWDGGYSYISVSFRDLKTGRLLAVSKSSGQGMSINEDQEIALGKIKKELINAFGRNDY